MRVDVCQPRKGGTSGRLHSLLMLRGCMEVLNSWGMVIVGFTHALWLCMRQTRKIGTNGRLHNPLMPRERMEVLNSWVKEAFIFLF